jgi:hypothetical protein
MNCRTIALLEWLLCEEPVTTYRLYCFSELTGRVTAAEEIEADSDEEALAQVRSRKMPVKCELWHRDRLVAELDPHET